MSRKATTAARPRLGADEKARRCPVEPRGPRPHCRRDCEHGPRPCPWVLCRYHLGVEPDGRSGRLLLSARWLAGEMAQCCALDVAEEGGLTLDEVGERMGVSRERVRQLEASAMEALRASGIDLRELLYIPPPLHPGRPAPHRCERVSERRLEPGVLNGWGTCAGRPPGRPPMYGSKP